jgi:8-oxo-dGTP diphosphatase
MKFRQQVAVGGAIVNSDGKLLFVRRVADDEFMPGVWELPGGGTEYGEHPEVGLKREVQEECGIEINVGKPITVSEYYIERNGERVQRVEIIYLCQLISDMKDVVLSDEHDAYEWKKFGEVDGLEMTEYMAAIVREVQQFLRLQ